MDDAVRVIARNVKRRFFNVMDLRGRMDFEEERRWTPGKFPADCDVYGADLTIRKI